MNFSPPRNISFQSSLMFYWSLFIFAMESLSSIGQSVQNLALWSVLDLILKIRSKHLRAHPQKNFKGQKTCTIWPDFWWFQTLMAYIFGKDEDIQNWTSTLLIAISPAFGKKSSELWFTNYRGLRVESYHQVTEIDFLGDHISTTRGCCATKFLHVLENGQVLLVHTLPGMGF